MNSRRKVKAVAKRCGLDYEFMLKYDREIGVLRRKLKVRLRPRLKAIWRPE